MKKVILIILALLLIACEPSVKVQEETDQEYVRTQIAKTLIAEWSATETQAFEEPTKTPEPSPTPQYGTMDNPVPIGQPLDLIMNNNTYFNITVLETIRGDQAWQMVYQANMFNSPPEENKEYIVAKIRVEYTNSTIPDNVLSISSLNFGTLSNNQLLEDIFVVNPSPELSVDLLPGGMGEGYISGIVFKDDPNALLYFKDNFFGNTRFYFAIHG